MQFLFLYLDMVPRNSTPGGFAYIWQSKWVGIIAIKTERTQIHFLSDILIAVASLDLKVPICLKASVITSHSSISVRRSRGYKGQESRKPYFLQTSCWKKWRWFCHGHWVITVSAPRVPFRIEYSCIDCSVRCFAYSVDSAAALTCDQAFFLGGEGSGRGREKREKAFFFPSSPKQKGKKDTWSQVSAAPSIDHM